MKAGQILASVSLLMAAAAAPAQTVEAGADRPREEGRAIYRTVDENGNVVFTDNPPNKGRAEPVTVGPVNTMESRRSEEPGAARASQRDEDGPVYRALAITAPADGATVRLPQDNPVTVRVTSDPPRGADHRLVILDNGVPMEGARMDFPNPGSHQLQAVIEDADGRPLIRSQPVTFYVHRIRASDAGDTGSGYPTRGDASQRGEAAGRGGHARPGGAAQRGGAAGLGSGAQRVTRPANP